MSQRSNAARSPYSLLVRQTLAFADNPLLILPTEVARLWGLDRRVWTYGEVQTEVDRLAGRYRDAGYGPGHRVAVLAENRPAHFIHWLALNSLGVSLVPVNPDYTADELSYLLEHSESALLVTVESRAAQVADVARSLKVPVILDHAETIPAAATAAGHPVDDEFGAEAALIYTSGTTGRPKGCLLSNGYFLAWGDWYTSQGGLVSLQAGQERLITPLPTFHVNAMGNSFMGMLASGGAQVIVDRFHPRSWWDMAIETGATCFHYLGVMPAILLAIAPSAKDRAHRLRFGVGGGVHPDHHGAFEARFGVPLLEGWAMTESGGACLLCAVDEPRHVGERCLGRAERAGPQMEARLVDDAGNDIEAGAPGELLVRAAGADPRRGLFSGYLKNEAATAEIWAGDWLHTGDVMRRDLLGNLYFVDRKKNIIRRSGENIAAVEVEGAISSHPGVAQVAVVAVLDPLRGEEVMAVVVAKDKQQAGPALASALLSHCAGQLAYFKLPGYIAFLDTLPTTSTQKIRKADLGTLAQDPMSHPDCHDLREAKQALRIRH
ncbi:AMP-binding protein [Rhizobium sp. SL86]|uniref:AMP-binding protein n=1 Tax=Rhizobium sp. SL86 TaxID=2995148 RepID=UPI002273DC54|nr:AMP-binding protein [Rhizobium sp. SL86]MCY1667531.1 AMP-binding protein [Rhizobium sp. SL86]